MKFMIPEPDDFTKICAIRELVEVKRGNMMLNNDSLGNSDDDFEVLINDICSN